MSWRSVDAETIQPEIFENEKLNTLEDDTSEQASFLIVFFRSVEESENWKQKSVNAKRFVHFQMISIENPYRGVEAA